MARKVPPALGKIVPEPAPAPEPRRDLVLCRVTSDQLRPWVRDEVAGFPPDRARLLVRQGLAEPVDQAEALWLADEAAA